MEKKLKRIGIDSSYLNKIAEGSISLKPSDEYFIEDDVLTEFILSALKTLSNPDHPKNASAKTRLKGGINFFLNKKIRYIFFTAERFLQSSNKTKTYSDASCADVKKFLKKILRIIESPGCRPEDIAKTIQSLPTYRGLNNSNEAQSGEREGYWERFLAQSGHNEHVDLSKLEDAVWKGLSDGIEIGEINKANIIPETKSKKQFIGCLEKNGFKKDREDVFTNGDLEVFFDGLKVRVKVLKDKDYIKENYIALYAYTVHQSFLVEVRNTKKDIKIDKKSKKSKKYFYVKLR
ncbi:MAG: hypothetical protein I8H80_00930 [Alphaproteobacteria bacterium]|nr:hypothetical protein [Alphaproteobacteria bacterium]